MYALTVEGAALELWMERWLEKVEADEAARREIMQGAIVKSVISSAVKGAPTSSTTLSPSYVV